MKRKQNKISKKDAILEKRVSEIDKAISVMSEESEQDACNGETNLSEEKKREREQLFRAVTEAFSELYEDAQRIAFGQEALGDYSPRGKLALLVKKVVPLLLPNPFSRELQMRGIEPSDYPDPLQEFPQAFVVLRDLAGWRGGQKAQGMRGVTMMTAELSAWCQARGLPFDNEPDALKRLLAIRLAEKCKVCSAIGHMRMTRSLGERVFIQAYGEFVRESKTKLQEALDAAQRAEGLRRAAQDNAEEAENLLEKEKEYRQELERKLAETYEQLKRLGESLGVVERVEEKVDGFGATFKKLPGAVSDALYSNDKYPPKMLEEGQKIREGFKRGEQKAYDWGPFLEKWGYPTDKNKQRSFLRTLQNYAKRKRK